MSRSNDARVTRLLLVDDEPNILSALKRVFQSDGYHIETFTEPAMALTRGSEAEFDLVISDYRMPEVDGVSFLTLFRTLQPDCARLILSGFTDLDALLGAINDAWIFRFITKPWHDGELRSTAAQALAHRAVMLENRRLADLVRLQERELNRQQHELDRLEREHPGICRVRRANDGSILLDGADRE
jgi:DNA-binding NtrC family response regulator